MKSSKILRSFFIGCSLFAATALSAQTLVTSWEAEDFVGNGFQVDANNIPIVVSEVHSGGKFVQRISQSQSLLYYVKVETAGVYDLKVFYMVKASAAQIGTKIGVRVNNQVIRGTEITVFTDADNSATPASIVFPVYLDAGINLIRVGQNGAYISGSGYTPNFDYFELYTSEATLEKPQDDTETNLKASLTPFIEAGDFTKISGTFSVTTASENTTAANLIDNNPATEFVSDNASETITITYPASLGIFCLRGIAATNPHVRISAIERSKDGIVWDATGLRSHALFDLNKAVSYSTVSIWRSTDEPTQDTNFKDYIYYRFTVTKPAWESQLKISDLKICGSFQSYVDLTETANGGTPTLTATGNIDGSNGVANAFDNNFGSKVSYTTTSYTIIYPFSQFAKVTHYSLTTAGGVNNSLARDAKSWTFEGSGNGVDYVVLDNVTDYVWANVKRATYLHKIQSPAIYKYYKLNITAKQGTDAILHFGEIQMFGTLESSIATNVEELKSGVNVFGVENQIVLRSNSAVSYQIVDIAGKMLKEGTMQNSEISVPASKGIYMVKTINGDLQTKVTKVVVR